MYCLCMDNFRLFSLYIIIAVRKFRLKLENGWTNLANIGLKLFVEWAAVITYQQAIRMLVSPIFQKKVVYLELSYLPTITLKA